METTAWQRASAATVGALAAAALVLQYVLIVRNKSAALGGAGWATLEYFSYFTILSNLIVLVVATSVARGKPHSWWAGASARGAAALYIGVTGCIYALVLSGLWAPTGLQWLADVALHYVVPLAYLGWWLLVAPHGRLVAIDALRWLAFPLAYVGWVFVRGSWLHAWPYPFMDVDALGLGVVLRNSALVCGLFVAGAFALIGIDRLLARSRR